MRIGVFFLAIILTTIHVKAQSKETPVPMLNAPDDWRTEIIPFPLEFAPEINFVGIEDIRFSPGWAKTNSETFWTYAFIWYLDKDPKLNAEKIEELLVVYFDGLMHNVALNGKDSDTVNLPKTVALFINKGEKGDFIGKISVYDAFFTKKVIVLNVKANYSFCEQTGKHSTIFHLSPQSFDHNIWSTLSTIQLKQLCQD